MPITIVSALPKTAQAPASDTTGSAENSGPSGDFASLLLGQLFQVTPGASSVTAALGSFDSESASHEESSDGIAPSDPLALLAALSQAPAEQRGDVSSAFEQSTGDLTPGGKMNLVMDNPATAGKLNLSTAAPALENAATADSADIEASLSSSLSEEQTRESGQKAAKFAVPATALPAELDTSEPKSSATPAANAPVSPSAALPLTSAAVPAMRESQAALAIPTNFHDQRWNTDFSQKIVWLASHQKQSAELTLNPPHLGNIEVSVRIDSTTNTATASFVSAHADVRESIESALPRLREMFAHAGISLGQTNVSAESFRQAGSQWNGMNNPSHGRDDNAILEPDSLAPRVGQVLTGQGNGLVDTFV